MKVTVPGAEELPGELQAFISNGVTLSIHRAGSAQLVLDLLHAQPDFPAAVHWNVGLAVPILWTGFSFAGSCAHPSVSRSPGKAISRPAFPVTVTRLAELALGRLGRSQPSAAAAYALLSLGAMLLDHAFTLAGLQAILGIIAAAEYAECQTGAQEKGISHHASLHRIHHNAP
jgi:hypothetical protein